MFSRGNRYKVIGWLRGLCLADDTGKDNLVGGNQIPDHQFSAASESEVVERKRTGGCSRTTLSKENCGKYRESNETLRCFSQRDWGHGAVFLRRGKLLESVGRELVDRLPIII